MLWDGELFHSILLFVPQLNTTRKFFLTSKLRARDDKSRGSRVYMKKFFIPPEVKCSERNKKFLLASTKVQHACTYVLVLQRCQLVIWEIIRSVLWSKYRPKMLFHLDDKTILLTRSSWGIILFISTLQCEQSENNPRLMRMEVFYKIIRCYIDGKLLNKNILAKNTSIRLPNAHRQNRHIASIILFFDVFHTHQRWRNSMQHLLQLFNNPWNTVCQQTRSSLWSLQKKLVKGSLSLKKIKFRYLNAGTSLMKLFSSIVRILHNFQSESINGVLIVGI